MSSLRPDTDPGFSDRPPLRPRILPWPPRERISPVRIFRKSPGSLTQGWSILLLALLETLLGGCSFLNPPIFEESDLRGVDLTLAYPTVEVHYRSLAGKRVMIGGRILRVDNRSARAYVLLAPSPLDSGFRPEKPDPGARPILLIFPHRVDPSRLRSGRWITVIGRVKGERRRLSPDDGRPHRMVAIEVLKRHLWRTGTMLINGGSPFPTQEPGADIPFTPP